MIPQAIIDKIFDVAPIEEVVGEYVTLKRAGANYKGLCPFHDDKNASMSVSPSKGIFKCFQLWPRREYFSVHNGTRRPFVSFSHKTFSRQV